MEKREVYSLHRYTKEDGTPDFDKIFKKDGSPLWFGKHIDSWLLDHLESQPDEVRKSQPVITHLRDCKECRDKRDQILSAKSGEDQQPDLPVEF